MDILLQLTAQQVLNYKHKKLVHYSLYQIIKKKNIPTLPPMASDSTQVMRQKSLAMGMGNGNRQQRIKRGC